MLSTNLYHLKNNLKNVKNTHRGVLFLVKLQASACNATLLKVKIIHGGFHFFKIVQVVLNHAKRLSYINFQTVQIFVKICANMEKKYITA